MFRISEFCFLHFPLSERAGSSENDDLKASVIEACKLHLECFECCLNKSASKCFESVIFSGLTLDGAENWSRTAVKNCSRVLLFALSQVRKGGRKPGAVMKWNTRRNPIPVHNCLCRKRIAEQTYSISIFRCFLLKNPVLGCILAHLYVSLSHSLVDACNVS